MKNLYGTKRPFGIATFPKVELVSINSFANRKDVGFYDIVETAEPLSYDDIDNFELCVLNEDREVIYKYGSRGENK